MNFTPETAVSVSQIVVMLLVATMLGPWAKQVLAPQRRHRRHRWLQVTSWLSYFSKAFALFGLLINMQTVSLLLVALSPWAYLLSHSLVPPGGDVLGVR
ncbi:hypothetical protein [Auritidibacter ignavus]|uniref:hypothetical protein n=1 Tax=Auritidibacter ignavus TaxID=678932 RepID=UPI002FE56048